MTLTTFKSLTRLAALGLSGLLWLVGCQESKDTRSDGKLPAQRNGNQGVQVSTESAVSDLFKSEIDFTVSELSGGKMNCDDIIRRADLRNDIYPWPDELKRLLAKTLIDLPITNQVLDSVHAIYLISKEALLTGSDGPAAAGLACDRGTDYKGILFLNYDTFVTDRKSRGVGKWQNFSSVQSRYIRLESGDNAALTLVHESLHAIDNKLYINGLDPAARAGRAAVFDMSWYENTRPKFERIDILSLTDKGDANEGLAISSDIPVRSGCGTRLKGDSSDSAAAGSPLALTTTSSAQSMASELRFIAEKTNFIVPYAMATAAEDFAESLTIYYFGAYQNNWQTRTVYDRDISNGTDGAEVVYAHKTQDIIDANPEQKNKLCKMAELVFTECKL